MPDFDDHLMIEMQPELEQALKDMAFPSGEIDMHSGDYARIILAMLDIPVHKLANNKSLIESLHVLFTLFSTFRSNQHF
jgi:intraflagellar transport protein 46